MFFTQIFFGPRKKIKINNETLTCRLLQSQETASCCVLFIFFNFSSIFAKFTPNKVKSACEMPNWHISYCNFVAKAIFNKIKKTQHAVKCSLQVPKEIFTFPSILSKWCWPKNHHFRHKNTIFSMQTKFPCACAFTRVYAVRVHIRTCVPTDAFQNFSNYLIKLV